MIKGTINIAVEILTMWQTVVTTNTHRVFICAKGPKIFNKFWKLLVPYFNKPPMHLP